MQVYKDLILLKDIAAIVKDSKDKGVTSAAGTATIPEHIMFVPDF